MLDAGSDILGKELLVTRTSACDMRHLGNQAGIPCVSYGPGNGPVHTVNEYIVTKDYLDYIKFIALTVYRWCS